MTLIYMNNTIILLIMKGVIESADELLNQGEIVHSHSGEPYLKITIK